MTLERVDRLVDAVRAEIGKVIVGQEEAVELLLTSLLCGGHVLLEGVPGTGKTFLVQAFAAGLDLEFGRIQFTPDMMPGDVLGTNLFNFQTNSFTLTKGPIFTQILLADEINRTPPKTQAALLQAMGERAVTIDRQTHELGWDFMVVATQNPIEQDGTYPLPEAQMDRFMFNLIVPNPGLDELMQIVDMTQKTMAEVADAACSGEQLLEMRATASQIPVANEVMRYAMTLCSATHADSECASEAAKKYVRLGASPRAGQALISAAKVRALMQGRYNVAYSDVNALALPVLRHRMKLNFEAIADRVPADDIVRMIVAEVSKRFDVDGTVASVDTKESTAEGKKKRGFGKKTS